MESFAASPPLRRETTRARQQSLQFNGCMMTGTSSGRRPSRASTPWPSELASLGSQCSLVGNSTYQTAAASRSQSLAASASGSQASTSPCSDRSRLDSEGGDSLDSLLGDEQRGNSTRTQSCERRTLGLRSNDFEQQGRTISHSPSLPGYLGRGQRSRPCSAGSGSGKVKLGDEGDAWLWLEDVRKQSDTKVARVRQASSEV